MIIVKHRAIKLLGNLIAALLAIIVFSQVLSSCMQFRMSPEQTNKYYTDPATRPRLVTYRAEGQEINLAYQDNGKTHTAVFIHGAPGSWSAFREFFKYQELRSLVNIIAVDRPGYGYSTFGQPLVSLDLQSKYIYEALRSVTGTRLVLVGHSLGGPVAAKINMDYDQNVAGSVLVAPSIDPELEKREWYRYLGKMKLARLLLPTSLWVTNEEIFDLKPELQAMLPSWRKITNPVIVIQGDADNLVPMENAYFAEKMLPDSLLDIRMLPGVNHFIPWSHPQEMVKAISDLLPSGQ